MLWFILIAIVLAIVIYGCFVETRWIEVTHHTIQLERLPPAFDGFKILHLTDLHAKRWGRREQYVTDWVAQQDADVVAVTGDVVVVPFRSADVTRMMTALNHRLPVWFVLGNHDVRDNPALPDLLQAWRTNGINVLRNSHERLERDGSALYLVGVDDPHLEMADLSKSLKGIPDDACKILLAHSSDVCDEAVRAGVDLVLSGHTHGGQIRLPFIGAIIYNTRKTPRRYAAGHFRMSDDTQLFVSRGIGYSTVPMRLLCRPQLAVLTLRCARS